MIPSLGFGAAAAIIISGMIGLGVFLKGRVMACETGSTGLELAAWALAGAVAFCGALSVAELAAMMPQSGGTYVYVRRAFGPAAAFTIGWAQLLIAAPASIGALASGGAIFFNHATGGVLDTLPHGAQCFAAGLILAVTALNCAPVRVNGNVAIVSAVLKIGILAGIAATGLIAAQHAMHVPQAILSPATAPCADVAPALRYGAAGFAAAMLSALYAYNGWVVIANIAGEIQRPETTIPRALFVGVTIVVALYLLANAAFARVLGFAAILQLSPSASLGITAAERLFGNAWSGISSAILLASAIATMHVVVLNYSRVTYAVARDGLFMSPLATLSKQGVPIRAVVTTSAIALCLVLVMGFERLSDWFTFEVWLIFVIAVGGLFALRRSEPQTARPYRVIGYPFLPGAFLIVAGCVLAVTAFTRPLDAGIALAITLTGLPAYAAASAARTRRDAARSQR